MGPLKGGVTLVLTRLLPYGKKIKGGGTCTYAFLVVWACLVGSMNSDRNTK